METTKTTITQNKTSKISITAGTISVILVIFIVCDQFVFHTTFLFSIPYLILFAFTVISAITAVVSGIVSLRQIGISGEAGRGVAIIGILLAIPTFLVFLCSLLFIWYLQSPYYF